VRTLAADDAGRLWLGTDTGLMVFDPSSGKLVEHFTRQAHGLPSNHVRAIELAPDGKVWIGTGIESFDDPFSTGGVGMFDGSSWTVFHRGNSSLPINSVFSLLADGEAMWVGTFDSLVPLQLTPDG
jgi:ligand-binding sensor domain-containing protein